MPLRALAPAPDPMAELGELVLAMPPAQLRAFAATLDPEDLEVLERVLANETAEGWRGHPAAMAHHLSGGAYKMWPYIELLSRAFAAGVRGEQVRQLWNLPSQYGKTSLAAVWGPVWALDFNPSLRIMYVSYDADRAVDEAGKARDLAEQHVDQLRFSLRPDRRARGKWTTSEGGGLYAVGIRGSIVGFPADVVVCDDLLKGWQAAHSATEREFVWSVYRSQVRLRIQSTKSPIFVIGTRWHENDPTGRALAGDVDIVPWHHIRLPAIAEKDDPLGRAVGETLEPERFPAEEVQARRTVLGNYLWSAMEAQRPAPEEGGEIKRAWWRFNDAMPIAADAWATSWDMKLKDKESGDFVVGQCWARTGPDFWCVDQLRGQWNFATTKLAIVLLYVRHPQVRTHLVENSGNGPEVMGSLRTPAPGYEVDPELAGQLGMTLEETVKVQQVMRQGMGGMIPINPKGSKVVRARAVSPLIEAGNVHLPLRADWAASLVDEAAAFPRGTHDDQVDSMSQALARLHGVGSASAQATTAKLPPNRPGSRMGAMPGSNPAPPFIGRRR